MDRVSDEMLEQLIDNWKYDDLGVDLVLPLLIELKARRAAERRPDPLNEGDGTERL